ncbi:MAG: DUF2924 domain-containing protein [Bryobacterales bacterium]|nr:DUF2924 domain-containing protein [Bryobacterales bacterium]
MDTRLTPPRKEKDLEIQIRRQIEALKRMTVRQLRERYQEVFGEESRSNHKQFLFRRIAWRLQAQAEGGLSERARRRALEIANDNDLRIRAPKGFDFEAACDRSVSQTVPPDADPRRPLPGMVLEREYKGRTIKVKVHAESFDYEGRRYRSLSAIAKEVTGTKWNGYLFFHLPTGNGNGNKEG